jgi:hypothetical protein
VRQAELSAPHTLQQRVLTLGLRLRRSGWNGLEPSSDISLAPLRSRSRCSLPSFQDGDLVGETSNNRRVAHSTHRLRHVDHRRAGIVIGSARALAVGGVPFGRRGPFIFRKPHRHEDGRLRPGDECLGHIDQAYPDACVAPRSDSTIGAGPAPRREHYAARTFREMSPWTRLARSTRVTAIVFDQLGAAAPLPRFSRRR